VGGEKMKINRINDVTKLIIFAATVITICVLCALGFKMANEGKSAVTENLAESPRL
jgi:hypothetical protein